MTGVARWVVWSFMAVGGLLAGRVACAAENARPLVDVADAAAHERLEAFGATVETSSGALPIRVSCDASDAPAGIAVTAPEGTWDLSPFAFVQVPVRNPGETPVTVYCRVENAGFDGLRNGCTARAVVLLGQQRLLRTYLASTPPSPGEPLRAMNETPDEVGLDIGTIDARQVTRITVYVEPASCPCTFEMDNMEAAGEGQAPEAFFPFIDEFGQYRYREWPGKVHDLDDLVDRLETETADLDAHPGPADRNQYGGWTAGPQLEVTGHFRCEKYRDKWWLVDPEGRLFYSVGPACVSWSNRTLIEGNEEYFGEFLPTRESALGRCYAGWAPEIEEAFDFGLANVMRKYGENWTERYTVTVNRRFRSWGLNTIANWSNADIIATRKTPYVVNLAAAVGVERGTFPDVEAPAFADNMHAQMQKAVERGYHNDPWCIGFFVDNELVWEGVTETQAETYFETIREVMKAHAPNKLYLGCRFALWNPMVLDAAAQYCDVLSFNLYWQPEDIAAFTPQTTADVPCMIGEFHFAAPDRGLFHADDRKQKTQQERADAYAAYVRGCLRNAHLVGCHWFQYADEPATGRWFDEENGQIGFVDICDTPYAELVAASRAVAYDMYAYRLETKAEIARSTKRYVARQVAFQCDGQLDEWDGTDAMPLDELKEGAAMPAPEDFHGVARIGWNEADPHRLYCAAVITDDAFQDIHPPDEGYWEDDSLEVMVDLLGDLRMRQWTLGADGKSFSAGATPENTEYRVVRDGNHFVFEVAIDLSKAIAGFAIEPGASIGLTVNYNDCENDTREHQIGWVGGFPWNPANLGEVVFDPAPAAPATP